MNGTNLMLLLCMILIAVTMGTEGGSGVGVGPGHGIGGNRDEGGCYISAGYHWCPKKQKCLREWEEPCDENNDQGD